MVYPYNCIVLSKQNESKLKKKKLVIYATTWMNSKNILSEKKLDTKENILCDSIYRKFKIKTKVCCCC